MRCLLQPLLLAASLALGCQALTVSPYASTAGAPGLPVLLPDLPVAHAPFHEVEVNWKQRLPERYVYLEARGSYTRVGALLEELHARITELGVAVSGPPFALYYDDPGRVAVEDLRLRACFPVADDARPHPPLRLDVLPSTTVVYAYVAGAYPEVPRAYPGLYAFMDELGWVENGPVREVYLVNPAEVESFEQLVTEVQVPATSGGR
jgi:effector-binding domain-containing protein